MGLLAVLRSKVKNGKFVHKIHYIVYFGKLTMETFVLCSIFILNVELKRSYFFHSCNWFNDYGKS